MAQTGFTPIQLYRTATASAAPTSGNLTDGELAINTNDGKLFYKDSGGNVQTIASTASTSGVFAPGTVSAPGLTFSGDTNTGIYSPAADTIAFTEGGVESMRIDSSGNVGIGTSTPTAPLDVNGSIAITGTARRITGDFSNATNASRTLFQTNVTNNNSNVGIMANGTGTSSNLLLYSGSDPDNASVAQIGMTNSGTEARIGSFATGTGTARPITFSTTNIERMRIDTSGNVGIGTSSPGDKLQLVGRMLIGAVNSTTADTGIDFLDSSNTGGFTLRWLDSGGFVAGITQYSSNHATLAGVMQANNGGGYRWFTNGVERMRITSAGNVVAGGSVALATTATDGFLYVPTCAGTPTGTPTAITGMAPIVINTTNNKLYFYSGGAWRDAGP